MKIKFISYADDNNYNDNYDKVDCDNDDCINNNNNNNNNNKLYISYCENLVYL